MKNNTRGAISIWLVVLVVVVVAGVGYFAFNSSKTPQPEQIQNQPQGNLPSNGSDDENQVVATDETLGWQTYRNEKYSFEFKYPNNIKVSESTNTGDGKLLLEVKLNSGITFNIYEKNYFTQWKIMNLSSDEIKKCRIYNRISKSYGSFQSQEIEFQDCPGSEAPRAAPHVFSSIFLRDNFDLVVISYDNPPQPEILKTLKFL